MAREWTRKSIEELVRQYMLNHRPKTTAPSTVGTASYPIFSTPLNSVGRIDITGGFVAIMGIWGDDIQQTTSNWGEKSIWNGVTGDFPISVGYISAIIPILPEGPNKFDIYSDEGLTQKINTPEQFAYFEGISGLNALTTVNAQTGLISKTYTGYMSQTALNLNRPIHGQLPNNVYLSNRNY